MTDQTTQETAEAPANDFSVFVIPEEMKEPIGAPKNKAAPEAPSQGDGAEGGETTAEGGQPDQSRAREAYIARHAKRVAEQSRQELEEIKALLRESATGKTAPTQKSLDAPKRPNINDPKYGDLKQFDPQYIEDMADYEQAFQEYVLEKAFQKASEASASAQRAADEARQSAAMDARVEEVSKRGVDKYPDFFQVIGDAQDAMSLSDEADAALARIENAEDVLYTLAKSPERLERLSSLSPVEQVLELGRLSAQIGKAASVSQKVTKSPTTPAQPRGANGQFKTEADARYEKMLRSLR